MTILIELISQQLCLRLTDPLLGAIDTFPFHQILLYNSLNRFIQIHLSNREDKLQSLLPLALPT